MDNRRTDRTSRIIHADAQTLWQAWFDPAALVNWLPPKGMEARLEEFDPRPGGAFRLELRHLSPQGGPGKTTADSDRIEGRFVSLNPPNAFEQDIGFDSGDPQFSGTMRMRWTFVPSEGGTVVTIVCSNVPPGIRAEDHVTGLAASLGSLAAYVEKTESAGS